MTTITEMQVQDAVLRILARLYNLEASMDVLNVELSKHFPNNQTSWEDQIRNIKSHHTSPGNIFHDNYVITSPRDGWQITPNGERYVKAQPPSTGSED